jgi:general secretion pathway protein G
MGRGGRHGGNQYSSFTLVELLVVIAILGLLTGLMVPTVGKAREASQNGVCLANLKQWGSVTMTYVADNNGTLPFFDSRPWYTALWQDYLYPNRKFPTNYQASAVGIFPKEMEGTIYECPRMKKTDPSTECYRSYGMNSQAGNPDTGKILALKTPSQVALIAENRASSDLSPARIRARHGSNCNVLYADGHVSPIVLTKSITNGLKNIFWGTN